MQDKENPAPPEIVEERDRLTIRYGNTEVILEVVIIEEN